MNACMLDIKGYIDPKEHDMASPKSQYHADCSLTY